MKLSEVMIMHTQGMGHWLALISIVSALCTILFFVFVNHQILKKMLADSEDRERTDTLTQVLNRSGFNQIISELKLTDSKAAGAIILFDVDNFILAPTPNTTFTAELHYFYRPASLTAGSGSGTTWLSINAELSLLYGALVEAYIFMKGEQDMMAYYDKRFTESLSGLKMLGEAKETTDEYRTGKVIRAKQ